MEPTFGYLDELSDNNVEFKMKIITIILNELPKDFNLYHYALDLKNYHWAAEITHRMKQKIAFLQMSDSLKLSLIHI